MHVIRLNGLFAIQYPKGISPTIYNGEGNCLNWPICSAITNFSLVIAFRERGALPGFTPSSKRC